MLEGSGVSSDLRVGTSIGHGQQEGLGVLLLEVLVGELLTVDGLASSALHKPKMLEDWDQTISELPAGSTLTERFTGR